MPRWRLSSSTPFLSGITLGGSCLAAAALLLVAGGSPASAAQSQIGLGTATSYAVLAGSTVTNTGPTTISGDVGLAPGSAVTGFPPGLVGNGSIHAADAAAQQAQNDLTTAYNDAAGRGPGADQTGQDLGGQTLLPGVYNASTAMALTGTVTLDALGDPAAVFVFQAGSTLDAATNATVSLTGAAQACNVFWQVGSTATLGTSSHFVGTVIALTSITMQTGATIQGRLLARNGQVALDTNVITRPACASVPASTSPSPTATAAPTSASPDGTFIAAGNGSGGGGPGSPGGPGGGSGTGIGTPSIPTGHPETGRVPAREGRHPVLWLVAGIACLGGAAAAAQRGARRGTAPVQA